MNGTRVRTMLLGVLFGACTVSAQSPREEFKQIIGQLQQNASDDGLREKAIQAAANLDPAPAIPEEARRHYIEGVTLHQEAKSPEDEKVALEAFSKALEAAPWWGDIYLGQSVSQELAGRLEEAKKSLHFYLLSNPSEEKARSAQDHIYVLEAKMKKAQVAVQASQQQLEQHKALTGWWQCKMGCSGYQWIQADSSDLRAQIGSWSFAGHFEQDALAGLATLPGGADPGSYCAFPEQKHRMTAFVEENATVMRLKYEFTTYQSKSHSEPDAILGNLSPRHICDGVTPVNTSPQEIVLVGGAKQNSFGVAIITITPGTKDLPTDKETANAVKDGFNYCKKSQKVEAAGVLITSVAASSSAAVGGLKAGDIIHLQSRSNSRGSTLFCTAEELSNFLSGIPPGNKFALEVFDGSKRAKPYEFIMGVRGEAMQASLNNGGSGGKKSRRK